MLLAEAAPIWPAIWSAIAATFTVATAVILLSVHLLNRADSVRPEVVLEDWEFSETPPGWGRILIKKIRNEGRGPTLHMRGQLKIPGAKPMEQGGPFAGFIHEPVYCLPPAQPLTVDWQCLFQWQGASLTQPELLVPLHLTIFIHDIHGRLHELVYELAAMKPPGVFAGVATLANGVYLSHRFTKIVPGWRLRWRGRKAKFEDQLKGLYQKISAAECPPSLKKKLQEVGLWDYFTREKK
jgi:hypothetical protein